jgi:hypothetical protein
MAAVLTLVHDLIRRRWRLRRKERVLDRMIAVEREIVNLEQVIEVTRGRHSKGAPMLRKRLVALRAEFMALAMEYEGIAR